MLAFGIIPLTIVFVLLGSIRTFVNDQSTFILDEANTVPTFKVCYTDYIGFTPIKFAYYNNILKKHADAHGIAIDLVRVSHYVDEVVRFSTGEFSACTMTIEGVASIPMVEEFLLRIQSLIYPELTSIKDPTNTTVLVVAGYSNGNDMIIANSGIESIKDLKGKGVLVEEGTAQEYMLARALDLNGMSLDDVVIYPSAMDNLIEFETGTVDAVAVRCPLCEEALNVPRVNQLFNSSKIPGELLDLIVVNTEVLSQTPTLGVALASAWYETLYLLQDDRYQDQILQGMANISGFSENFMEEYERMEFMLTPNEATDFYESAELQTITQTVLEYLFNAGIFDDVFTEVQQTGVRFPNGVMGDKKGIRVHFDSIYTEALKDVFK